MDRLGPLPKASIEALISYGANDWNSWSHVDEAVRAIATPVVAAELRRFADAYAATIPADHLTWDLADMALNGAVNELRSRADELDA